MQPEFITYQKFNDPALADELVEQLDKHGIAYKIEEQSLVFNITFVLDDPLQKEYAVKIKSADFEKANKVLMDDENEDITKIGKDYYLFEFTDEELMDLITKADEWSTFDVVLSRKILAERGKVLTDDKIEALNEERLEELKKTEPSQTTWIIVGYLIALGGVILPFFVSAIGVFIGWYLSSYKKTLPNGERVYGYNKADRAHGKRIVFLAIVLFVLNFIFFVIRERN